MKWTPAALLLIGIVATTQTMAHFGGFGHNSAIEQALESDDYDAWVAANEQRMPELTQELFDEQVQRYDQRMAIEAAIESNDFDAWQAIVGEQGTQARFETEVKRHNARDAIESALAAKDYDAWVSANQVMMPPLTEEDFNQQVNRAQQRDALHEAFASGDYDAYVEAAAATDMPIMSEDDFSNAKQMRMMRGPRKAMTE